MIEVNIQRNLICLEDLAVGTGSVDQVRGPASSDPITLTKINGANLPYDATYSMQEKFDQLIAQIDSLPAVVDEEGTFLTGFINTSDVDLDLEGRLWNKEIDADTGEIYYGDVLLFQYDPTDGNLILPVDTDYIAADAVVTAAFEAADTTLQDNIDALSASLGTAATLDVGTSEDNIVQLDAVGLPAVDGSQLTGLPAQLPIGAIVAVPYTTPDTDFLECNGAAISRTTYAALFAKMGTTFGVGDGSTTFNLPDFRGEFLRGYDNGRGVDASRVFGSSQSDAFKAHTHTYTLQTGSQATSSGGEVGGANSSSTTGSSGSSETRPRNIAIMYQIKVL